MGRRVPPQAGMQMQEGTLPLVRPSPTNVPGGASGIVPEGARFPEGASAKIHFPPGRMAEVPEQAQDAPKVRRFMVQNCPKPINGAAPGFRYLRNGVISHMVDGKVIDATMYDLDDVRRQGIDLKDLGEF